MLDASGFTHTCNFMYIVIKYFMFWSGQPPPHWRGGSRTRTAVNTSEPPAVSSPLPSQHGSPPPPAARASRKFPSTRSSFPAPPSANSSHCSSDEGAMLPTSRVVNAAVSVVVEADAVALERAACADAELVEETPHPCLRDDPPPGGQRVAVRDNLFRSHACVSHHSSLASDQQDASRGSPSSSMLHAADRNESPAARRRCRGCGAEPLRP